MSVSAISKTPIKPKASFCKLIDGRVFEVQLFQFSPEQLKVNQDNPFLDVDPLNPRLQTKYNAISNADLDFQIHNNGQIMDAVGRFQLDQNGHIKTTPEGIPFVNILDGSRRFDCCSRNGKPFSIVVGKFDDELANKIISSSFDAQLDLSCLELGLVIDELQTRKGRNLKAKEIIDLLDYKKSRDAVSDAKKALRIYKAYPTLLSIYPVISMVGKATVSKIDKIVKFAEERDLIEDLIKHSKSELYDYTGESGILDNEDLMNFDAQKNAIITESLEERVGYVTNSNSKKAITKINDFVDMEIKANKKPVPRTTHQTAFNAELTDEERHIAERFFRLITDERLKDNPEISMLRQFEMFERQFT